MRETVDVANVRESPMMDKDAFSAGIDHSELLMTREPFPEENLLVSQIVALLEQLRNVSAMWTSPCGDATTYAPSMRGDAGGWSRGLATF